MIMTMTVILAMSMAVSMAMIVDMVVISIGTGRCCPGWGDRSMLILARDVDM